MKDNLIKKLRFVCASQKPEAPSTLIFLMIMSLLLFLSCTSDKDDSLTRIRNSGEISFAMEGTYPPFNFYNDKNELVGFDVDVAREVGKRLGVKVRLVATEWGNIIQGLRSGAYDGILGSMAVTEERMKIVAFSVPYYYSGSQLMVRKDAPFKCPADLKGRTIGVVGGTTYEKDAMLLGASRIRLYKDDYQCLRKLHMGVLDGIITDKVLGLYQMTIGKFDIKCLGVPLRREKIAVAFRKEDDNLLKKVNKILEAMSKDDTLDNLIKKVALCEYNDST